MCGNEFSQLRESPIYVLLPPALTAVGEDTASDFLRRAYLTTQRHIKEMRGSSRIFFVDFNREKKKTITNNDIF